METIIGFAKMLAGSAVMLFGVYSCQNSEWFKEMQRQNAAQELADQTPHVIRQADGCKVYAFKSGGNWHYFTRCGDTVTTERTYTEVCGKGCTRQKSEEIITKGNR